MAARRRRNCGSGGGPEHGAGAPLRRRAGRLLLAGLLMVILPLGVAAQRETRPLPFGESARLAGCLRLTAQSYRDRSGGLENYDWVTLVLRNECPHPVGGVLVELYLISVDGQLYGRRLWVLDERDALLAGGTRKDRYAIPDPGNYTARGWALRMLQANRKRAVR